ncbi:MAG TPA: GNAT family N-acetyltransferase [Humisphaera sp.]|jgi:ribosomal protein S18 acetylase RimI-like enzyme|nr:GNAT family N-acetyltransferase [Humisphaera sp.]
MTIRPATAQDIPSVLPMVTKIARFHEDLDAAKYGLDEDPAESYRSWLAERARDQRSVFLVADAASSGEPPRLVAFLVGGVHREIPIYRLKEYGFIYDLWVEEPYRNEGIARQLVTLALERFEQIGVEQVRLDTLITNAAARGLFKACGFRESVVEMLIDVRTS